MAVAPPDDPNVIAPYPTQTVGPGNTAPSTGGVLPSLTQGGGYTQPDWTSLLNTYLQPYQSIHDAQIAALTGRVGAQSQLAKQRFSGSDTSTMARLGDEHADLARRIVNTLAGQGLYDSGARQWQQNREALRFKRAQTDASNQLLDYLTGLQSGLADARFQGLLGLQNQKMSLASMLGSLYQPTVNPAPVTRLYPTVQSRPTAIGSGYVGGGFSG